jgi:hypothetical protein
MGGVQPKEGGGFLGLSGYSGRPGLGDLKQKRTAKKSETEKRKHLTESGLAHQAFQWRQVCGGPSIG